MPYVSWFQNGLTPQNNSCFHATFRNFKVTRIFRVFLLGFLWLNKDCLACNSLAILPGLRDDFTRLANTLLRYEQQKPNRFKQK